MKKVLIVMAVVLLAVCLTGIPVYAKAQKVDLEPYTANPQYAELTGGGFVIFNNSSSPNNLEVTISVKKADTSISGTELDVYLFVDGSWYDDDKAGTMTLNRVGNGNFHINVSVESGTRQLFVVLTEAGKGANMFRAPAATASYIEMDFK